MQIDNANDDEPLHSLYGVSRKEYMQRLGCATPKHKMKLPVYHLTLLSYYAPNSCNLSYHGIMEGTKG